MKTSNLLKISLCIILTMIIIVGILEIKTKHDLKECESRQSFRCPRFTCHVKDDSCGTRPYICPSGNCNRGKTCIGYCGKNELNCFD